MAEQLHVPDLPGCLPWVHEEGSREPVAFGPASIIEPESLFAGVERRGALQERVVLAPYLPRLVAPFVRDAKALDRHSSVAERLPSTAMTTLLTERYGLDLSAPLEEGQGVFRLFSSILSGRDGRDFNLIYQVQPEPPKYSIGLFEVIISARRGFVNMRDAVVGPPTLTGQGNVMKVPGVARALQIDAAVMRKAMLAERRRRSKAAPK